jgi:hypothetical protein
MPEDTEIELTDHLPDFRGDGGNYPWVKGCPPPEIYEVGEQIPEIKSCPPPDWYQEPCP